MNTHLTPRTDPRRAQRGASALETALILPFVCMVIGMLIYASYALSVMLLGHVAVGQGARAAGLGDGQASYGAGSAYTRLLNNVAAPSYGASTDGCIRRLEGRWGQRVSGAIPFYGDPGWRFNTGSVARLWGPWFGPDPAKYPAGGGCQ